VLVGLGAQNRPSENHRDAGFDKFLMPIFEDVKYLFQSTKGQPFIFPSTGTGAWESALTNCLSPGYAHLHSPPTPAPAPLTQCCAATPAELSLRSVSPARRDKVVCFRYGQFSHLWIDQAQRLGLEVEVLEEEWGRGADEARLEAVLKADTGHKIKAVLVVHNETTTGVTSDIHGCRKAIDAAKHPALFFVDGVRALPPLLTFRAAPELTVL
jgi:alanine-glyoxylate transaminase/serine-glyoxylate transaminase/serine-pyruvate transaminase